MVTMAILAVVLIGVAALALDLGRVFVLRTEMQNAVDAAALAAAKELNGENGAQPRARAVARDLLIHQNHFARVKELLGQTALPDDAFAFYCSIGSRYDVGLTCAGAAEGNRVLATGDGDTHYVRVRLEPRDGDGHYVVDLFFLPVLSLVSEDVATTAALNAEAVAGRHFFTCHYPPLMMCDPFENGMAVSGVNSLQEAVNQGYLNPGDMVVMKYQSNTWAPGNFAFLLPGEPGQYYTGAKTLGEYIANPGEQSCTPPLVMTKPGSVQSYPMWAMNTYFDLYEKPQHYDYDEYPPAPDVMEFPMDTGWKPWDTGGRFGNGQWDRASYWAAYHSGHSQPSGWDGMSRWDAYNWEISSGNLPCDPRGADAALGNADDIVCPAGPVHIDADHYPLSYTDPAPTPSRPDRVLDGYPDAGHVFFDAVPHAMPNSVPERRRLFVASVACDAQGVRGNTQAVAGAFAEFFVLQRAKQGASAGDIDYVTEFIGLASEEDEDFHVDVQLYE
jgi:hypothetical protein